MFPQKFVFYLRRFQIKDPTLYILVLSALPCIEEVHCSELSESSECQVHQIEHVEYQERHEVHLIVLVVS